MYTYTVKPTPELIAQGMLWYADLIAAVVFLGMLVSAPRLLDPDEKEPSVHDDGELKGMTMTTATTGFEMRVPGGIAYLNRTRPSWHTEVDPGTLDIGSGSHCVSAQLYAHDSGKEADGWAWKHGMQLLGLDVDAYTAYGFRLDDHEWSPQNYGILTQLWREAIEQRRASASV
jgi:hypothetical protein